MKNIWNNLNMASKLILVFSLVSVIPLIVSSLVLYQVSTSSLEAAMEEAAVMSGVFRVYRMPEASR